MFLSVMASPRYDRDGIVLLMWRTGVAVCRVGPSSKMEQKRVCFFIMLGGFVLSSCCIEYFIYLYYYSLRGIWELKWTKLARLTALSTWWSTCYRLSRTCGPYVIDGTLSIFNRTMQKLMFLVLNQLFLQKRLKEIGTLGWFFSLLIFRTWTF
jgi:hypothetical protein